ncbi:hypothetical protein AAFF_G00414620 [Aldrovandia affinis]|uniref:Uncharacterized protein n=1 Tax=Aldrovandia affinis TaxID=143900 RepID=A0AAD7SB03_9TELE|nr:hypothetical protein AAFF_G00414620 [Aldrovandia affinis]
MQQDVLHPSHRGEEDEGGTGVSGLRALLRSSERTESESRGVLSRKEQGLPGQSSEALGDMLSDPVNMLGILLKDTTQSSNRLLSWSSSNTGLADCRT